MYHSHTGGFQGNINFGGTEMLYKPESGDLVAVPCYMAVVSGASSDSSYGIVVGRTKRKNFWNVLVNGKLMPLHVNAVVPMISLDGIWLQIHPR